MPGDVATGPSRAASASALIRRGDDILLVLQQGPVDQAPAWALPGGRLDAGEVWLNALRREVFEATGLEITGVPSLAFEIVTEADGVH